MPIEFEEILRDLELKRAAALPGDAGPAVDVETALAELELEPAAAQLALTLVDEDGGERPLTPAVVGRLVADALTTLALAGGEADADTAAARAAARAPSPARSGRRRSARPRRASRGRSR